MKQKAGSILQLLLNGVVVSSCVMSGILFAQPADNTLQSSSATIVSAGIRDERSIDRREYGDNAVGLPVWSPLSDFENRMIARVREPQTMTPRELAGLYLLASGEVRDTKTANQLSDKLWVFLNAHDDLRQIDDEEERGAALLSALHDDLFVEYDEAQSTVSGILTTGTYNCISSALVYLVLAREIGLQAKGVLMPSHAFVEIELADGRKVDVETTADEGFGMVRDAAFFARQAEGWFAARDLEVPSYEDYQQRRTVTARALGLENMWNQHLSPSRASYPLRLRMAEIRGAMEPQSLASQQNRFVYYYQESDYLRRSEQYALRWRLLSKIEPVLARFDSEAMDTVLLSDQQRIPLQLLQSARAQWLASDMDGLATVDRDKRRVEALQLAGRVLRQIEPGQREYDSIRLDATLAVSEVIQGMIRNQQFQPLPPVLSGSLQRQCLDMSTCQQSLDQFHAAWANRHWQQSQWSAAIEVARGYLSWAPQSPNRAVFEQNMESAYLNQFATLWQQEFRDEAFVWLQNCIRLPNASRCRDRHEEVAPYFQ